MTEAEQHEHRAVDLSTLSERVFDRMLVGQINNPTGMRLFPASKAKKAMRKRVQAARKRNR